ncbi:hypothetical protein [Marispirochaeta aestuarii]|uniref:hypothetical protein n=1 Tax=Marispirochaeta aestuarii TaxID=1963862 RepID=UPI002ABDB0D6|nr:hypothetical protein [Marispirochaeta aestuarii]
MERSSLLPIYQLLDIEESVDGLLKKASDAANRYETLFRQGKWPALKMHAEVLADLEMRLHREVAERASIGNVLRDLLSERDAGLRSIGRKLREIDTPEADSDRKALMEALTENYADADKAVAAYENILNGIGSVFERGNNFARIFNIHEEQLISSSVFIGALSVLARLTSILNLSAEKLFTYEQKLKENQDISSEDRIRAVDNSVLTNLAENIKEETKTGFEILYTMLTKDADVREFRAAASNIITNVSPFTGLSAKWLGIYLYATNGTEDLSVRVEMLKSALAVAEWQNRAVLLRTYASFIVANTESRDINRWYSHEKKRVEKRRFESLIPTGVYMEIDKLSNSSLYDGDMVQIEGLVQNLRIMDDPQPPKFSSIFELTDLKSGSIVKIRAHMFSLAANGLCNGGYCRLNGFLRKNESWLDPDGIGIDVDRVSLSVLRSDSWMDDITYRMKEYYTLYLNEMNLFNTPCISKLGD